MGNSSSSKKSSRDKIMDYCLKNTKNTTLPDFIERKIYSKIFDIMIHYIKDKIEENPLHILNIYFQPEFLEIESKDISLPKIKITKNHKKMIEFFSNEMIDTSGFDYIPNQVEKTLYENIIIIALIIFELILKTLTIKIGGYTIQINIQLDFEQILEKTEKIDNVDETNVSVFLDKKFENFQTWYLPESIEYYMYKKALILCNILIHNMFECFEIKFLHKKIIYKNKKTKE